MSNASDILAQIDAVTGDAVTVTDEPAPQVITYDPLVGAVDADAYQDGAGELVPVVTVADRQAEQQDAADALTEAAMASPDGRAGTAGWQQEQQRREVERRAAAEALDTMDQLREFIASKLSIPEAKRDHYLDILSLWMLSTYSYRMSGLTAYLYIVAKKRGSGKSQVGKLAYVLTPNPTKLLNPQVATPAVLADFFEEGAVTLFDETDKLTTGEAKEMSALLNLGNVKGGSRYKMRGGKQGGRVEQSLFAPKVVMGIAREGVLPFPEDTLSRGITLEMEECSQDERRRIGRFAANFTDYRDDAEIVALRQWMQLWSQINQRKIRDAVPELPDLTGFRRGEVVEPIVALADLLGATWPERIRAAIVALDTDTPAPVDPTDAFMTNLATVLGEYQADHAGAEYIPGADLFEAFKALSAERLTAIGFGKRLAAHKVESVVKKIAGKATRVYPIADLAELVG